MPLAPFTPALTIVALVGVLYADWIDPAEGRPGLLATGAMGVLGALYFLGVVRRRAGFALRAPADAGES
jgi:hypothetical protein